MPIPPSKGRPMQTITRAQMQIIEIKWEDEKVGGQDLNMRLAVASWELLIIGHEHQSVHRHVSFPSQLLSHRAFHSYETVTQ